MDPVSTVTSAAKSALNFRLILVTFFVLVFIMAINELAEMVGFPQVGRLLTRPISTVREWFSRSAA